ncbi:hypothetical protein EV426DRAFT_707962 [Tirmania nivea]|nr:hypothetical protein EV426DRAFT_707962 [Tirmania nivea]
MSSTARPTQAADRLGPDTFAEPVKNKPPPTATVGTQLTTTTTIFTTPPMGTSSSLTAYTQPLDTTSSVVGPETTIDTASSPNSMLKSVKIGIAVAIPILFLLIGGALFLFLRRIRHPRNEKDEVGEVMIIPGKHGHLDEGQNSRPSRPTGFVHPGPPPQASDGHMYAPPAIQDPSGYQQSAAGVPVVTPVARQSPVDEEEFMHRPVSPVHDNLLTEEVGGTSMHMGRSGTALGGSILERGSPTLDDDREMQWILEEERKAKERREQQGRLPHSPSSSMGM